MSLNWIEQLQASLVKQHGNKKGLGLFQKYSHGFSLSYRDDNTSSIAASDINYMEALSNDKPLTIHFYHSTDKSADALHLRLFQWQKPIPLCDIMPMLENVDLRAYDECPHKIKIADDGHVYINDFTVEYSHGDFDIAKVKDIFLDAFNSIYLGLAENDGFNKLIIGALLSWREVMVLRAYAKYLHQVGFRFTQAYIEKALFHQVEISKQLIALFLVLHDPDKQSKAKTHSQQLEKHILQALESVTNLDEDRILRRFLELIKATLRTNYFLNKDYVSLKLNSQLVPELPKPVPLYETFVYSPRFEAIHLRSAKVARGGIRWSDRREDYRTEVLGLMKAQKVKNSVIVPSGAKGGFVLKALPLQAKPDQIKTEVIHCYQSFIRGLLDITDNIKEKKVIHPKQVVCLDDADPYLVVAADKGTASFSDIANGISNDYQFWLGDAFASGGSHGYDHKKMGITARGAWESIKRHFRELSIDCLKTDISVVGIGDMSGDVFGNGMIYSRHIKLLAAFDHRHIFIDPSPNAEASYHERVRLFNLPTSSWEDYNPNLISKGGGVFKRSSKSITLTSPMKQVLGTDEDSLTPNELIRVILQAPVELLYNGGIGTYVKASTESHADVGDRTNEYCRINGNELRCKIVGEGGNLGFTQLARVEYALAGGLINTDFIDNSAGVDCSDHEVNLKILLDREIHLKKLTFNKRDELLVSMTDEVADLVLEDNYYQALVMSFSSFHSEKNITLHISYLRELETLGVLNRKVEFLPDEKVLLERKAASLGLTRPEMAVLLAYTKIHIKAEILKSTLPEDTFLHEELCTAFPASLKKKYHKAMDEHLLHRDIIATQLSNQVVNEMGVTFVYRMQMETGASVEEIIRAHAAASHIFDTPELNKLIMSLDFHIPMAEQYTMLYHIRNLLSLATRWFLHDIQHLKDLKTVIEHYRPRVKQLEPIIPTLMGGNTKEYMEKLIAQFLDAGLSKAYAERIATYRAIYSALNIIAVATNNKFDLIKTAKVYFAAGERVNLLWIRDQISSDSRDGHWNVLARLTLRDELDISQRALTIAIINHDKNEKNTEALINKWSANNQRALERWEKLLALITGSTHIEYTMFFIAARQLLGLILTSH